MYSLTCAIHQNNRLGKECREHGTNKQMHETRNNGTQCNGEPGPQSKKISGYYQLYYIAMRPQEQLGYQSYLRNTAWLSTRKWGGGRTKRYN